MMALCVARCCWMRGVQWPQRGHFHFPSSKMVEKVWPLLWNSGHRVSDWLLVVEDFGWISLLLFGEGGRGESWKDERSGWMSLLLFAGGGRGESWEDGDACKNVIIDYVFGICSETEQKQQASMDSWSQVCLDIQFFQVLVAYFWQTFESFRINSQK